MSTNKFVTIGEGFADITLSRPLIVDGASTAKLRMREPTVRDLEVQDAMSGTDATKEISTFANLCSVSSDDIRALPMRDYVRMQVAYRSFID